MSGQRIAIAGGGAAGFFAAIACAEAEPRNDVRIYERSAQFLTKVRISGGGRCNVTHRPTDARTFSAQYPRGARALIGALHRFSSEDTVAWFRRRGVTLKVEPDGRMFPVTDSSGTVIDCLKFEAKAAGVKLISRNGIESATVKPGSGFNLELTNGERVECDQLLLATGGARDARGAQIAESLGHTIEPPVPSLFAIHVSDGWLRSLPGVSIPEVEVTVPGKQASRLLSHSRDRSVPSGLKLRERGPVLITHNGLSGPAILRLSAWGARELAAADYNFKLRVNWLPNLKTVDVASELQSRRTSAGKRMIGSFPISPVPARLWENLVALAGISSETRWTNLSRDQSQTLIQLLTATELQVHGKTLNKDEFVTCGGVRLREVNFKTMESRIVPHLYFAGELLDIDGITGGFNFQAAWTTGWIAGRAMAGVLS